MNICVKTGAMMADNLGRLYACDLFKVGDTIIVRGNPLNLWHCHAPPEQIEASATHRLLLDYSCWDRLDDLGVAVVPLGHVTGELLL